MMTVPQSDPTSQRRFQFQSLAGFFMNHPSIDENSEYSAVTHSELGLLPRSYGTGTLAGDSAEMTPWQQFQCYVEKLNENASDGQSYKVIYITRHGEGFHNVMEDKVGTEDWERHWALLDGDGTITWADANLTDEGVQQAIDNGKVWSRLIEEEKMQWPSLYSSPMRRCLETTRLVFGDLANRRNQTFHPVVKELLRERLGRHTCDRRSTKSWIKKNYPDYPIETGFAEKDELFKADYRETLEEHAARTQTLLEDVFEKDPSAFIAFTMHSGSSKALMLTIGHEQFRMAPASTMVFFVKAERLQTVQ